jgi:hypothetical protein
MAFERDSLAINGEFWPSKTRRTFFYPHQVASDPNLTNAQKREILSAWASDMHAVESMPALRQMPGTPFPVTYSAIMDAMALLDRAEGFGQEPDELPSARRPTKSRRPIRITQWEAA